METNRIEIKTLYFSLVVLFLSELIRTLVLAGKLFPVMPVLGITRLVEVCLIVLIVSASNKGLYSIGLDKHQFFPGLKRGLIWSFCFGTVVFIVFGILFFSGINPLKYLHARLPSRILNLVFFFIVGGFIAPIAEEIVFRGIIFGFFRRWGFTVALLVSTLFFAFAHYPGVSIIQLTGGILFGVAYELDGKLMTPITIHILANLTLFTLSVIV